MLRPGLKAAACAAVGLAIAACAAVAPRLEVPDDLAARVDAVLARRGSDADQLRVIDNILLNDGAVPPPFSPPVVRDLLVRPLAAANGAALTDRAVPAVLRRIVEDTGLRPAGAPARLQDLLDTYLSELADAQRVLKSAARKPVDAAPILVELDGALLSQERLKAIADVVDAATIERANALFLEATARFVRSVQAAGPGLSFPERAMRFDSAIGVVVIGTTADDVYQPGAALIVDPGGSDVYRRASVTGGAVSVIVDLAGNDRYEGSDVVVHGLSAILDLAGDDRYVTKGPGLGAAIAGAALILDAAGNDNYEAANFAQGAGVFGLGAILDLRGNDSYRVRAGGQGFAMTGGVGLLWDREGNDSYTAGGLADAYDRGGGVSMAQGAATGSRTALGGGVGILRDDAGDDIYEAQMFAQGAGYYYGLGLLWDGGGNDRYRAVRYAQGAGVHEAAGVLRDESGDDHYELTYGVGQGMGLDLAVGALLDGGGDDRYRSEVIAQGSGTANGIGFLWDSGGADEWRMGPDPRSWGHAEWARRLPTTGFLLYDPRRAAFLREGKAIVPAPLAAELGGPSGGAPAKHEPQSDPACPAVPPIAAGQGAAPVLPLVQALRRAEPGFAGGKADPEAYEGARLTLTQRLKAGVAELPRDDFEVAWVLSQVLRCAFVQATADEAAAMVKDIEGILKDDPASPFAAGFAYALRDRRPPVLQMAEILDVLDAHPACPTRASALSLRQLTATDEPSRARAISAAQTALGSSCWRMQATALVVLKRLGQTPSNSAPRPLFLRAGVPGDP
ncbi:MAG TPA: hypothetical protein VJQ51_08125 [Burkholderiales bacterium]|nr:hypothetical protein [Burkholderiales bacterium]